MADKVTTMVIKVDLQCPSCYKKVKKLLCKFPEIRDQIYDEKQNTVTITVESCCPMRIRDKLCCKGGKTIKSIEIKPPPKPKDPEKKPKDSEKPKETEKKPTETKKPKSDGKTDKPTADQKPPTKVPSDPKPPEPDPGAPFPVPGCPTFYPSGGPCLCGCGYGYGEGPCNWAYGRPVPWYDNYGYGPYGYCRNMNRYVSPHECFSEENVSACDIM